MGLVLLGLAFLQVGIGYYSVLTAREPEPVDLAEEVVSAAQPSARKRAPSRWVHIFLGIALLTISGLNIPCEPWSAVVCAASALTHTRQGVSPNIASCDPA